MGGAPFGHGHPQRAGGVDIGEGSLRRDEGAAVGSAGLAFIRRDTLLTGEAAANNVAIGQQDCQDKRVPRLQFGNGQKRRMNRRTLTLIVVCVPFLAIGQTNQPRTEKNPPTLNELESTFRAEIRTKADSVYETGLKNLRGAYKNSLETALKRHSSAGELDEALVIKEERDRFLEQGVPPMGGHAGGSSEVQQLRKAWSAEIERLDQRRRSDLEPLLKAHLERLRNLEVALTKAMRLDEAKLVREAQTAAFKPDSIQPNVQTLVISSTPTHVTPEAETTPPVQPTPPAGKNNKAAVGSVTVPDLGAFSKEDQEIIKGLKFSRPEPAPLDTRRWTYIKGRIKIENSSQKNAVVDRLEVEMLMLCRDRDKKWTFIQSSSKIDVTKKGVDTLEFSFRHGNDLFEKLNEERDKPLIDSYTLVRFDGVPIAEFHSKLGFNDLKEWWKDGSRAYSPRQ